MIQFEGVRISRDDTVLPGDGSERDAARVDRRVTGNPSPRQAVRGGEPEPSRQELVQQLDAALKALESQLEALHASGAQHTGGDMEAQGSARLKQLNALRDQLVSGTNGMPLAALRAEVTAAVASTLAYTSDIRAASSGPAANRSAAEAALHEASEEAHRTVTDFMHDFYDRRIFDPYLKFASEKDKEEYQRREEERKQEIEKARAEHTPEGELRALDLAREQMKDAKAHGAGASPDFAPMEAGIDRARTELASRIEQKAKSAGQNDHSETLSSGPDNKPKPEDVVSPDVIAKLRAARVAMADQTQEGHGVNVRDMSPTDRGRASP